MGAEDGKGRQRTGSYLGALFLAGTGRRETPGALFIGDSGRAGSVAATFEGTVENKDPWPPCLLGAIKEPETQEHRRLGGNLEVDSGSRRGPVAESPSPPERVQKATVSVT